jgi:threonine dehydratase
VNERIGGEVFFKAENFQRTGSFKFRGAYNALAHLTPDQKKAGVITYSSGNHGQAIALSGRLLDVPTVVVMPDDAPPVKKTATEAYGAEVVLYKRATESREAVGSQLAQERGLTLIPPFDHKHVIAGQGTAALELVEETGPLDAVFVCVGGGGLISGWATALAFKSPDCSVYGAEPALGDDAARSLRTGVLHKNQDPNTIADGARTTSLGKLTFPIVRRYVRDIVTVSDEDLLDAVHYLWERLKVMVEPTGALATAAMFRSSHLLAGKRVGVILSGGNVDFRRIAKLM